MPKFTFRFQPLLALRRQQRERQRMLLIGVLAEQHQLEARRAAIERELRRGRHRARSCAVPGPVDLVNLAECGRHEARLRDDLAALAKRLMALEQEIAVRRKAVVEADREVLKMEKLCQRHQEQCRNDEFRRETKWLDEASARTFVARRAA